MNHVDRRGFLERAALSFLALPGSAVTLARMSFVSRGHRAPAALRLVVVDSDPPNKQQSAGISLGAAEARHAAALFGGSISLRRIGLDKLAAIENAHAVLGGSTRDDCSRIARAAEQHHALFMNIGCTVDAVRADCGSTTFHVAPSDAMLRDAVALARAGGGGRAVAWDSTLEKFGADTLNDRFRAQTGLAMDADAWLAWVAVKILWESALRARAADAATLAEHLTRETTQFDGHKGRPLSFRPWDHQLRQPLYVVAPEAKAIEVPPVRDDESSRDALDRLGGSAAQSSCHRQ